MHITTIIYLTSALAAGGLIGLGFAMLQEAGLRHHQRMEREGRVKSVWLLMPGSLGRVVCLLIALAIVQIGCPLLFREGCQWWVSAGVVGGYGFALARQLRAKLSDNK